MPLPSGFLRPHFDSRSSPAAHMRNLVGTRVALELGRTDKALEYVPHDISPHSPLVIVLHGSLMDAESMREWTGYEFDQMADQHGFVVVYPDGYKHNWNDCHCQSTFAAHP